MLLHELFEYHARERPMSLGLRCGAADLSYSELSLTIPMLLDGMDDAACKAFSAWPERIYILGTDGRIAYQGGHGPYDFNPEEARAALERMVSAQAHTE